MIYKSIISAFQEKMQRNWDTLYFAIDLHGTIIQKYKGNEIVPYKYATDVLMELSNIAEITLILFTSTYPENLETFYNWCKEYDINFKYLNENPDCPNNSTGDFSKKFYYNVLIDDRAGFDPDEWIDVLSAVKTSLKMQDCKMAKDCSNSLNNFCNASICSVCDQFSYYTTSQVDKS